MERVKLNDKKTGKEAYLVDKTSNSYLVWLPALTKEGIDAENWFTEKDFKERFEITKL